MEKLSVWSASDVGVMRQINQDDMYVLGKHKKTFDDSKLCISNCEVSLEKKRRFAIFDGMGGAECGEEASWECAEYLRQLEKDGCNYDINTMMLRLNHFLCQTMQMSNKNMGSTVVLAEFENSSFLVGNVGDSRAYLYHDLALEQLTQDHNEEAEYQKIHKELGGIGTQRNAFRQNCLTQYLGIKEEEFLLEPFVSDVRGLEQGDIILLCSDGLTGMLSDECIQDILELSEDVSHKGEKLLQKARQAGGKDNITLILIEVQGEKTA